MDERGWNQLIAADDALYESLAQEQADAKLRIAKSDAKPMMATVALAGFESPMKGRPSDGEWLAGADLMPSANPAMRLDSPMPLTLRLAKVFADPLNLTILTELNIREMSATQFKDQIGGDISVPALYRRFKMLAELGWLVKVDERTGGRRRGRNRAFLSGDWPGDLRYSHLDVHSQLNAKWLELDNACQLFEKATEAMEAGTLDARLDRHLSCSLLLLDELG